MGGWFVSRYNELSPRKQRFSIYFASGALLCALVTFGAGSSSGTTRSAVAGLSLAPAVVVAIPPNEPLEVIVGDSLFGRSGKVRSRFVLGALAASYPSLDASVGASPGVVTVSLPKRSGNFSFVTLVPFEKKTGDRLGRYQMGFWPAETRFVSDEQYDNPDGFIEVSQNNANTRVSEHFLLSDFITHDQQQSWPKYVVLQEALLDKLELVIDELARVGVQVQNVKVMSGFRTPYHNLRGLGSEGGARDSRHQFGDAADVIIDNNYDGRMDDLNGDRRVDMRDLDIVLAAVERVERMHPDLIGGLGSYHAMGPSGPFAHIDVRGYRARWNNAPKTAVTAAKPQIKSSSAGARQPGEPTSLTKCSAPPEFAVLCGKK